MNKPDLLKAENEVRKEIAKLDKQLSDYLITDASFWDRMGEALAHIMIKVAQIKVKKSKIEAELKAKDEDNA